MRPGPDFPAALLKGLVERGDALAYFSDDWAPPVDYFGEAVERGWLSGGQPTDAGIDAYKRLGLARLPHGGRAHSWDWGVVAGEYARVEGEARAAAEDAVRTAENAAVASALTLELVALLAPLHGVSGCGDANPANGFQGSGTPRCTRCALIQVLAGRPIPPRLDLTIAFAVR